MENIMCCVVVFKLTILTYTLKPFTLVSAVIVATASYFLFSFLIQYVCALLLLLINEMIVLSVVVSACIRVEYNFCFSSGPGRNLFCSEDDLKGADLKTFMVAAENRPISKKMVMLLKVALLSELRTS